MHWEERCEVVDASWPEALARFERRPATWMRPFLQLAVQPDAPAEQWFRLSPADDEHRARLIWRPHGSRSVFVRFTGTICIEPCDHGVAITLQGRTDGGDPTRNGRVLHSLVTLLADALRHLSDPDT